MADITYKTVLTTGCLLFPAGVAAAQPLDGRDGYYHHMWGDGYGFMGGGIMLLSWLAIILLVVVAVKWLMDRDGTKSSSSSALETLKMRFAKGEIDAEEYETRRKLLEG